MRVKEDRYAGREPPANTEGMTVADLVNRFLTHKEQLRNNAELNPRTYQGYYATCETVVKAFGRNRVVADGDGKPLLTPDDFRGLHGTLSKTRGIVALRNEMQRVRGVFKFAFDEGLILAPVRFGQSFDKPKLDAVRRAREEHRAEHGDRMFESAELRLILKATATNNPALTAMILLAANCAYGQSDISTLPSRAVDLDGQWVNFARVKTGIRRRCPLWPETVTAIRQWIPLRPKAKQTADAGLLFLTCRGHRWVKLNAKGSPADALGQEFAKVLCNLGLKRPRLSFYGLRHGFETIAGETADQVAVDAIMGHVPQGMSAVYRERIGDDRLRRVADHVRAWLFPPVTEDAPTEGEMPVKSKEARKPQSHKPTPAAKPDVGPRLRLFAG